MKSSRVMAFDFGLARIGVAVGNRETTTTQALEALQASDGIIQPRQLNILLNTWRPACLVVGLPLHMDGSESDISRRAKKFSEQLHEVSDLPVHMVDERLTSLGADQLLEEITPAGKSMRRKRKRYRDSLAAELILRTYFADN